MKRTLTIVTIFTLLASANPLTPQHALAQNVEVEGGQGQSGRGTVGTATGAPGDIAVMGNGGGTPDAGGQGAQASGATNADGATGGPGGTATGGGRNTHGTGDIAGGGISDADYGGGGGASFTGAGGGGSSGLGGGGGAAFLKLNGSSYDSITVTGGDGLDYGGGGGASVAADRDIVVAGDVTLKGGDVRGGGGGGGGALLGFTAGNLTVNGDIAITGGKLSGGGAGLLMSGGNITITSTGPDTGTLTLTGGANGGTSGLAKLEAGNLSSAGTVKLSSSGDNVGSVDFLVSGTASMPTLNAVHSSPNPMSIKIGTLDVTGQDTTLTLTGTTAGTDMTPGKNGVYFDTIHLGGGHEFAAGNDPRLYGFGTLAVTGGGNQWDGTLDAVNRNLRFDGRETTPGGAFLEAGLTYYGNTNVFLDFDYSFAPGTELNLISSGAIETRYADTVIASLYGDEFLVGMSGTELHANLRQSGIYKRKALAEGRLASFALLQDDLLHRTIRSMVNSRNRLNPFFAGGGGSSRYNTGSHIDVDGGLLLTGLAWNRNLSNGAVATFAPFFEGGWGNYDSYNVFADYAVSPTVRGDGETSFLGGGVLGRVGADPNRYMSGLYLEGSFRAGRVENDFSGLGILGQGAVSQYDSQAGYLGSHAGLGRQWCLRNGWVLDTYGKFLWAWQNSDNVSVFGDDVRFGRMNSYRSRLGFRLACVQQRFFAPYVGAAWDHEFDGDAPVTVNGVAIEAPTLRGDTGMGELGVVLWLRQNVSLDLGVQGYCGIREGASGSGAFKWVF